MCRRSCNCAARVTLAVVNSLVLVFASFLLYFGVTGLSTFDDVITHDSSAHAAKDTSGNHTTHGGDGADYLINPYRNVIFVGAFMLIIAVLGMVGAFKGARGGSSTKDAKCTCVLFIHVLACFVGTACLIYGAVFVTIFSDDADRIVSVFWSFIKESLPTKMSQAEATEWFDAHLSSAAFMLAFSACLLIACIACDSQLLGHDLTARRVVILSNASTVILGVLLVVAAVGGGMSHLGGAWLPYVGVCVGIFTSLTSMCGIYSVWKRRPKALRCYALIMLTLFLSVFTLAVMSFVQRDEVVKWVDQHWPDIEEKLVGAITKDDFGRQMHQHLNLLGISSCILLVFLIFNTFAAVAFWRYARSPGAGASGSRYNDTRQLVDDESDEEIGLHADDSDSDDIHDRSIEGKARRQSKKANARREIELTDDI